MPCFHIGVGAVDDPGVRRLCSDAPQQFQVRAHVGTAELHGPIILDLPDNQQVSFVAACSCNGLGAADPIFTDAFLHQPAAQARGAAKLVGCEVPFLQHFFQPVGPGGIIMDAQIVHDDGQGRDAIRTKPG